MVIFHEDRLVIEIETPFPREAYINYVHALIEAMQSTDNTFYLCDLLSKMQLEAEQIRAQA